MRSVFLVSLPCSMSSRTYQLVVDSLELRRPRWVTDGEILNTDRYLLNQVRTGWGYAFSGSDTGWTSRKWLRESTDPNRFQAALQFLDQVVTQTGFVYKDVINPFVLRRWLKDESGLRVLHLSRSVVEVAFKMLEKRWLYPRRASTRQHLEESMLEGLIRAERALESLGSRKLSYRRLIEDEEALNSCLSEWGGRPAKYVDRAFREKREREAQIRLTRRFDRLRRLAFEIREEISYR